MPAIVHTLHQVESKPFDATVARLFARNISHTASSGSLPFPAALGSHGQQHFKHNIIKQRPTLCLSGLYPTAFLAARFHTQHLAKSLPFAFLECPRKPFCLQCVTQSIEAYRLHLWVVLYSLFCQQCFGHNIRGLPFPAALGCPGQTICQNTEYTA